MKILVTLLLLIPSLSLSETIHLCTKVFGKEVIGIGNMNLSQKAIEKEWGDETFILKKDGDKVNFINSKYLPIDELQVVGINDEKFFSASEYDGAIFIRFSDNDLTFSQVSLRGDMITFLIAKCEKIK